jgi:predicted SnoaL-like aldol condensation-catalyzing enzyme
MDNETISRAHHRFYEWFQSFWAAPSGAAVAEKFAPDAKIHFTGVGTMSGTSYVEWMENLLVEQPDLVVTPVDYAGSGDLIYIFWKAASTINGVHRKWYGVDRFRIENGVVVEEHVIFDSATLQGPAELSVLR